MKIKPFNNIVLAEVVKEADSETTQADSGIFLPEKHVGRFIQIKILAIGNDVNSQIQVGSICYANPLLEVIDPKQPKVGFINSKDILGRIDK